MFDNPFKRNISISFNSKFNNNNNKENKMKRINSNKQQGFSILAVILVIVAVIVAIGVWALSGQTNTSSSGNSTSDIQASSLVNDSGALKLAYDTLVINGSSASSIVFVPNTASTPGAPNVLDPVNGVQLPKPNANAIKVGAGATEGIWVFNKTGFVGNGVGTASADPVVLVAGIKKTVCERVNNTLYGSTTIPVSTLATSAAATTGALSTSPTSTAAVDISAVAAAAGWTSGCFTTVAGGEDNVYFRVLKQN